MKTISSIRDVRDFLSRGRAEGKSIGFVPTMGYLHEGHLSLIRAARDECDIVVVSVFVNPRQFGKGEDLEEYPRDIERDKALAEKEGADIVFVPSTREMYPEEPVVTVLVSREISAKLCGVSRPDHFNGVATVVLKLLNIVLPDKVYLGQKDAQQSIVVRRMVSDLNLETEVRLCPTIREKDGLALSSRNVYLSAGERPAALNIYRALKEAEKMVEQGRTHSREIKDKIESLLNSARGLDIDYVEMVDAETLRPVDTVDNDTLVAIAAFVGKTRLIDNVILKSSQRTAGGR